jgi:hypothetical protein
VLRLGVQCGRRLVEHQQERIVPHESPGQGYPLPLAERKLGTRLARGDQDAGDGEDDQHESGMSREAASPRRSYERNNQRAAQPEAFARGLRAEV